MKRALRAARARASIAIALGRATLVAVVASCALASCHSSVDGAAVLVRWRITDGVTGTTATSCDARAGYCCASLVTADRGSVNVVIETMRLHVQALADDGTLTEQPCASCTFPCSPNEHTTAPELPPLPSGAPRTYKLTLEAWSCCERVGRSPQPLVRTLGGGDLANLEVQAIELYPSDAGPDGHRCTTGCPSCAEPPAGSSTGATADAACTYPPDAATSPPGDLSVDGMSSAPLDLSATVGSPDGPADASPSRTD